jgi:ketosteroid isomerase-like protein
LGLAALADLPACDVLIDEVRLAAARICAMSDNAVDVARAFVEAINRQDVEGLVGLMTEGHRFTDSLGNVVAGRETMRGAWLGYFRMVPDYRIDVAEAFADGAVVVMLGSAGGTYAPAGEHWTTPTVVRAKVEDGLVAEWSVFADNEPVRRLMRGEKRS